MKSERKAKLLLQAFNAAAAVQARLDELKAQPGATVDYTTFVEGRNVFIATNVPTAAPIGGVVTVVSTGHRLVAQGDVVPTRTGAVRHAALAWNKNPQKVVDFVAAYARKAGMLP